MHRRPSAWIPPIVLDRAGPTPLHRQIVGCITEAIRRGEAGTRLPSTRAMARLLGVSRNTVMAAYDELVAADLIRAARGSGMAVVSVRPSGPLQGADLQRIVRAAHYPARAVRVADADGNPLYIIF